jgi:hypothetical protein
MREPRYVHLDINGTPIRMSSDPLTAIVVYVLTFVIFTAFDMILTRLKGPTP